MAPLARAGERARRTGALNRAADSFAAAADLVDASADQGAGAEAARLSERAAHAAVDSADLDRGIALADRAQEGFLTSGNERAAARAQVLAGRALRFSICRDSIAGSCWRKEDRWLPASPCSLRSCPCSRA